MSPSLQSDVASLTAQRDVAALRDALSSPVQRVTPGSRADSDRADTAQRANTERVDARARGMSLEIRDANDGIGLVQTVDSVLGEVAGTLRQMRELASATPDGTDSGRAARDQQYGALATSVQQTLGNATFAGRRILADEAGTQTFQMGTVQSGAGPVTVTTRNLESSAEIAAVVGGAASGPGAASDAAVQRIDAAVTLVDEQRAEINKLREHFDTIVSNPRVWLARLAEDRDRIQNAYQAAESADQSRTTILRDSGTALAAQAVPLTQSMVSMLNDA